MLDGIPVFCGSKILLLLGDFGQVGSMIGGKAKRIQWVHFARGQGLGLVSRYGGRGA